MITILKHFIYEYAIEVIFEYTSKNFMTVNCEYLPNQGDRINITFMDETTKTRKILIGDVILTHRENIVIDVKDGDIHNITMAFVKYRDIIEWKLIGTGYIQHI